MTRLAVAAAAVVFALVAAPGAALAHFELVAPSADSDQDSLGGPQKSPPCGQDDPGQPPTATDQITTFSEGSSITITVAEKVFHPGHFRVALADDPASIPVEPTVTADGASACGSAEIQTTALAGVLADNMLPHTSPLDGNVSFQVSLPAGKLCTGCTLQVIQFMSDHSLNNPGGCFYHHCAKVNVVAAGTLPDGGAGGGSGGTGTSSGGGCDSSGGSAGSAGGVPVLLAVALLLLLARRQNLVE